MIAAATPADIELFGRMISYCPSRNARGIKLVNEKNILAMTGYDNWTPNSVQMHIYVDDGVGLPRSFVRESFIYPFMQRKLNLAVAVIPSDNEASIDFATRIGFVEKYRIPDGWEPGVDMILHELRKSDCIWVPKHARLASTGARGPTSHSLRMANG